MSVIEKDTLLYPLLSTQVQHKKTGNHPNMTEKLLTGM